MQRYEARRLQNYWDDIYGWSDPVRAARFEVLLDVLAVSLPAKFRCLDLGAGPGTLARRILTRFPRARVICVDKERPFEVIGSSALREFGNRAQWATVDFRSSNWDEFLGRQKVHATVSSLSLHMLGVQELRGLYASLFRRTRKGGVLLSADYLPWEGTNRSLTKLATRIRKLRVAREEAQAVRGRNLTVEAWWRSARRAGALAGYEPTEERPRVSWVSVEDHLELVRRAGFRRPTVIWQDLDERLIFAKR